MAYGLVGGVGDHGRHGTLITEEIVNAAKLDTAECIEIRQNNIEQVEKALLRAYKTGLEEIGLVAEGYAKATCPVDTGRLRNSVTHLLKGYDCFIGTNVEYAPYVEEGTFGNHEQSHMGQNYLKCLFALGFQGFLILICVAIYAVLIQSVAISGDAINSIWSIVGYTVLLCFSLFKPSSVTKSVLGAH